VPDADFAFQSPGSPANPKITTEEDLH